MFVPIADRSCVAEARRLAADLASQQNLDATDVGRVALVATELCSNMIKHAGCGELAIAAFEDVEGRGVELLALDRGPGIVDLKKSLIDGHSTTGTAGSGLGAIRRNSDTFGISSQAGRGTAVLARMRPKGRAAGAGYVISGLNAPYPGESLSGDGWATKAMPQKLVVLLADGSGHGPLAHEAAACAIQAFHASAGAQLEQLAARIHRALGPTRGAAIGIAEIDSQRKVVDFVGIGNISAALVDNGTIRRMASNNGTAGHIAPRMNVFHYPFESEPIVIMHSDGLTSRWDLGQYPGLMAAHPSLIAGVLYRDYRRGRDDASVITVRSSSAWPSES
jgi:anti-sigma regulatory factor (Ser/Thr protein kinase)